MDFRKAICECCGQEFSYFPMAKSAMDVGKVPKICSSHACRTNMKYRERTRNMVTGEYQSMSKINKL